MNSINADTPVYYEDATKQEINDYIGVLPKEADKLYEGKSKRESHERLSPC